MKKKNKKERDEEEREKKKERRRTYRSSLSEFAHNLFFLSKLLIGQYRRPWLGVEIANLHSSRVEFLEQFVIKFPYISAGVIVTKVAEASPAACSRILAEDVIVACDGKPVHSKLKFFELLWDKVGESVELNVARPGNGNELKVNIIVGESTQDTFYHWPLIHWMVLGQRTKNI